MIYFIRHGESYANAKRIWGADLPLTEKGKEQAAGVDPPEVGLILCSALVRARQTAEIVFKGREVVVDPTFNEINYGRIENTPIVPGSEEVEHYLNEPHKMHIYFGGDKVMDRAVAAMNALLDHSERLALSDEPCKDIALVAHRTLMASMRSLIKHGDIMHIVENDQENCSVTPVKEEDIAATLEKIGVK